MAWVPINEAVNPFGAVLSADEGALVGSTVVYDDVTVLPGSLLLKVDFSAIGPSDSQRVRIVLTGGSSDPMAPEDEVRAYWVDPTTGDSNVTLSTGEIADFDEEFETTVRSPDLEHVGEVNIALLNGDTTTGVNGTFAVFLWEEAIPTEGCFWTDLLNAKQDCVTPDIPVFDFESTFTGSGGFLFRDEGWLSEYPNLITQAIDSALTDWESNEETAVLARILAVYDLDTGDVIYDPPSEEMLGIASSDGGGGDEILRDECIRFSYSEALDAAGIQYEVMYGADAEFFTAGGSSLGTAFGRIMFNGGV